MSQPIPFGPFLLERRIAVGGSAEVFLARPKMGSHPAPHFVVKRVLRNSSEGGDFDTLEREARLHQAVVHPNVVHVFGAGMVANEPYLAMEYVDGVDLYRLLRRAESEEREVPPELACFIARRIALALDAVHRAMDPQGRCLGIVHRDVTPSNIYLSIEGEVKLGDFGIARVAPPSNVPPTTKAGLKGKFGYLAPEQIAGESFDHQADLFSLAAILGEILVGERVFPGDGQLAVLLAIRDVNVEPLRRAESRIAPELFGVCMKGLEREPSARFVDAAAFAAALLQFERPGEAELQLSLSRWVRWARDSSQLARRLQGQIRDSVERLRAVRMASGLAPMATAATEEQLPEPAVVTEAMATRVRRADGSVVGDVGFPRLIEMIATGDLQGDDEVALMGEQFEHIRKIESLARHLLPSTTATTGRLFEPGVPDYHALLSETPMLHVLARMRSRREKGAVFVELKDASGSAHRKEIYVDDGRLHHVASSEKTELLGEYLIRRGSIKRSDLESALTLISRHGGRLGDTLIGMGVVDAMDVFRAIRDQGRDRVAALCAWRRGTVSFYRNTPLHHVEFPLDLDLTSAMMAGVIVSSRGNPRSLLPAESVEVRPGPRAEVASTKLERGSAPVSLQMLPTLAAQLLPLDELLSRMLAERPRTGTRQVSQKEAAAALVVGQILGWIEF